ncbi:hypothetical protein [Mesorhizobium sp. M0060]|uniref:hypothetical protein n=1 Tax=Mesorhizobium sp. M0060 TaxID=2956866 RepID=UPI00333A5BE1
MQFARQVLGAKAILLLAANIGSGSPGMAAPQQGALSSDRAGVVYEISRDAESAQKDSNGSTSGSTDRDTLVERVLNVRSDGLELEYDLSKDATAEDRTSNWQFPVRIFRPFSGPTQLLNSPELEERIDGWLKRAGLTRAACGHWIFTWNAFKIECDPQSTLQSIEAFDLRPNDLRDGAIYNDPQASEPTTLKKTSVGSNGSTFIGEMSVDPEHVRRDQAESDVVVAEITKKVLTLADALRARSSEKVSGTIAITFDVDSAGVVRRRTKITKLETTATNGSVENRTITEIVTRRMVSDGLK